MKKRILIKLISVVAILGLIKSSVVLAQEKVKNKEQQKNIEQQKNVEQQNEKQQEQKNVEQQKQKNIEQKNAEQQQKKLSPKEEKEQQKQQEIKTIKEALNKLKSLEEQMQKKLNNMFKNFKKEDYEVKDYDLEVFKKNNAPILVYTHKKTGAKVFFNLILDKDKLKEELDILTFRAPCKDDRGLTHFGEHCLSSPVTRYFSKTLKATPFDINARTGNEGLFFVSKVGLFGLNEKNEEEYVKRLSKELTNPSVFEKDNQLFQNEKGRIINESKDRPYKSYSALEESKRFLIRDYNVLGETSKLKKVSLKDFEKFYKKYIHPSNCLLIKNVLDLNPKTIKNKLNLWHENYFSKHNKKETTNNKFELKNKKKYLFNSWPKDSDVFSFEEEKSNKKQSFKYMATAEYGFLNEIEEKAQIFNLKLFFKEELRNFIKGLGYDEFFVSPGFVRFFSNKKELFTQKALEENYKKIMNFISNKLKSLNEEDLLYSKFFYLRRYKKFQIDELNLKNTSLWCKPENFQNGDMVDIVQQTFFKTGKVISKENFLVNDKNEIESSYESSDKYVKQNLKEKFNLYDKLALNGPSYIDVFEKSDKTIKQSYKKEYDKYEELTRVVPIKFKNKNSKKIVEDFAIGLLGNCLFEELSRNKGLIYGRFYHDFLTKNNFRIFYSLNKDSIKPLEDYIFKNFDEIMKTVKLKEKDLKELKKRYKEDFKLFKKEYDEFFKYEKKLVKDFKNYIKTGKTDKNSVLTEDLKIRECCYKFFPIGLIEKCSRFLLTFNKDFKDYQEFVEKEMYFKQKYFKKSNETITPKFIKDFLENVIIPTFKKLKKAYKLSEKKLKELDNVEFSEVKDLIKTAYLVKDKEKIKEDNLEIGKKEKIDKEFFNSF